MAAALSDTKQHPAFRSLVARLANHQGLTKDSESLTSVIAAEVVSVIPMKWIIEFNSRLDASRAASATGGVVSDKDDISLYFANLGEAVSLIMMPAEYILELVMFFACRSDQPVVELLRSQPARSKVA